LYPVGEVIGGIFVGGKSIGGKSIGGKWLCHLTPVRSTGGNSFAALICAFGGNCRGKKCRGKSYDLLLNLFLLCP